MLSFIFLNDTATTEIYTYGHTLSLHDSLPISWERPWPRQVGAIAAIAAPTNCSPTKVVRIFTNRQVRQTQRRRDHTTRSNDPCSPTTSTSRSEASVATRR